MPTDDEHCDGDEFLRAYEAAEREPTGDEPPAKAAHTAEPWRVSHWVGESDGKHRIGIECDTQSILYTTGIDLTGNNRPEPERSEQIRLQLANAHRAKSCVNGCKGIDPAAVPGLVGALEWFVSHIEVNEKGGLTPSWEGFATCMWKARAALAAARGGGA